MIQIFQVSTALWKGKWACNSHTISNSLMCHYASFVFLLCYITGLYFQTFLFRSSLSLGERLQRIMKYLLCICQILGNLYLSSWLICSPLPLGSLSSSIGWLYWEIKSSTWAPKGYTQIYCLGCYETVFHVAKPSSILLYSFGSSL